MSNPAPGLSNGLNNMACSLGWRMRPRWLAKGLTRKHTDPGERMFDAGDAGQIAGISWHLVGLPIASQPCRAMNSKSNF